MKKFKKAIIEADVLTELHCNKCGENLMNTDVDFLEINQRWSYFSQKDGIEDFWDLCESCYDEFVKTFKIPLTKFDHIAASIDKEILNGKNIH